MAVLPFAACGATSTSQQLKLTSESKMAVSAKTLGR
jgi:hypothetical protein